MQFIKIFSIFNGYVIERWMALSAIGMMTEGIYQDAKTGKTTKILTLRTQYEGEHYLNIEQPIEVRDIKEFKLPEPVAPLTKPKNKKDNRYSSATI